MTKEKVIINGRGWSHTRYEFWHPKIGFFSMNTLRELEPEIDQLLKELKEL